MAFLNPSLLWFAAGGLIPLIIHLLHRQRFRRVRWAAMEFLLAAIRRTQRRLRLENLLLLLVRILAMVLLALALARPLLEDSPLSALPNQVVHSILVVDTSYSMSYRAPSKTLLDQAKEFAVHLVEQIKSSSDDDRFSVLTMNLYPEKRVDEANKKAVVVQTLRELEGSDYGTSALNTMALVEEVIKSRPAGVMKKVYILTDLQRNAWLPREEKEMESLAVLLKRLSHRDDTRFFLVDVAPDEMENAAVISLRYQGAAPTTRRQATFAAEIFNYSSVAIAQLPVSLFVNDALKATRTIAVPESSKIQVEFPYDFAEAGPHAVRVEFDESHDNLDLDDRRFMALDVRESIRVLCVDGEPGERRWGGETEFFRLALDPTGRGRFFQVTPQTRAFFTGEDLHLYDLVVLANVQSLTEDVMNRLGEYVEAGGGLLVSLGKQVDPVYYNESVFAKGEGILPARLESVAGGEEGQRFHPVEIRAQHKVFTPFTERMLAALRDVVFYRFFRVEEFDPDRVLIRMDDGLGSPLLLEKSVGEGKVLLLTSTLDGEWTLNFPGLNIYLPLAVELSTYLASRPATVRNVHVGDPISARFPVETYHRDMLLEMGRSSPVTIYPTEPKAGEKYYYIHYPSAAPIRRGEEAIPVNEGLVKAGTYALKRVGRNGGNEGVISFFACNLPPRRVTSEELEDSESNLARTMPEELNRRYPDFKFSYERGGAQPGSEAPTGPKRGVGVWRQLLYAVLGLLVAESVMACLFGIRKQ